jgi:hypothetical protein
VSQPGVLEPLLVALNIPKELQIVLLGCLEPDPQKRMSLKEVQEAAFSKPGYSGMAKWRRPRRLPNKRVLKMKASV